MEIKIHAATIEHANMLYDVINSLSIDMEALTVGYNSRKHATEYYSNTAYVVITSRRQELKGESDVDS